MFNERNLIVLQRSFTIVALEWQILHNIYWMIYQFLLSEGSVLFSLEIGTQVLLLLEMEVLQLSDFIFLVKKSYSAVKNIRKFHKKRTLLISSGTHKNKKQIIKEAM